MAPVGTKRYIHFYVVNVDSVPVTNLTLTDFVIKFLRDDVSVVGTDVLTLVHLGGGLYSLSYTPSAVGTDYLDLYNAANDIRMADEERIEYALGGDAGTETGTTAALTQDTGGAGALKAVISQPQTYTLYVFRSDVWQRGDHDYRSAVASTRLDTYGNWLTSPLVVLRDVYHIVLMNSAGATHLIRSFLDVTKGTSSVTSGSPETGTGTPSPRPLPGEILWDGTDTLTVET